MKNFLCLSKVSRNVDSLWVTKVKKKKKDCKHATLTNLKKS